MSPAPPLEGENPYSHVEESEGDREMPGCPALDRKHPQPETHEHCGDKREYGDGGQRRLPHHQQSKHSPGHSNIGPTASMRHETGVSRARMDDRTCRPGRSTLFAADGF